MISLKQTLKAITSKFSALNTLLNDVPHYTLLWTNPNPTSSFSAQTISLDLSKYDAVEVVFDGWAGNKCYGSQVIYKNQLFAMSGGRRECFRWRECSFNDTGITFATPRICSSYNVWNETSTTSTNVCTPIKIYGIKFGGGYKALRSLFAKEVAVC